MPADLTPEALATFAKAEAHGLRNHAKLVAESHGEDNRAVKLSTDRAAKFDAIAAALLRQPREEVMPHFPDNQSKPGPDTPPASPLHKEGPIPAVRPA